MRKSAEPNPATEIVCPTEPLKKRWIPDPRRLPPAGQPCRALGRQRARERAAPASDVLSSVARNRFGLARPVPLPAATESGHTEPTPPTDFCNCQRAWAHRVNDWTSHRTRCFGAFCRFGNWCPNLRAVRFPGLTPRTPEGKTAPACMSPSQRARKSRSGRLVTDLLNTPCRSPARFRQGLVDLLRRT
jgi:hypothetical protein